MTPFPLSEKDPALGFHELDHVSVLLRLGHNYILDPPRLQYQSQYRFPQIYHYFIVLALDRISLCMPSKA